MVKVSQTLKNRLFFTMRPFLAFVRDFPRDLSCIKSVDAGGHKNRKSSQKFKIILETCKETSKLSADSFRVS